MRLCLGIIACVLVVTTARAQSTTFTMPASLQAQGVPAIPASIVDEVRRYTEYRSASLQSWHPARREMLIATRFANAAQIHRV